MFLLVLAKLIRVLSANILLIVLTL